MKKNILSCTIFILFFAICIVACFLLLTKTQEFDENGIEIDADIVDIQREYRGNDIEYNVIVNYTIDGITYNNYLDTYKSSFHVGDTIKIKYLPSNPNHIAYTQDNYTILIVVISVLSLCILFFLIKTIRKVHKDKVLRNLRENGRKVYAKITDVYRKDSISINGSNPCSITAKDDLGNSYTAKFLCPADFSIYPDQMVNVFVDRDNPSKYILDFESSSYPDSDDDFHE